MKLKSTSTIGACFSILLLQELKRMAKWKKVALVGSDPEGVHQLRVSLRKMRTALLIFRPYIKQKHMQKLALALKGYANQFDNARDLDVYLATNFNETTSALATLAQTQRKAAYKQVQKLLRKKQFNRTLRRLKKSLKTGAWKKPLSKKQRSVLKKPVIDFANETLEAQRQAVIAISARHHVLTDEELHQLRIQFKKLRYTAEFFSDLFPTKSMANFISQIKLLQDNLGNIHDCFVVKALHQQLLTSECESAEIKQAEQIEQERLQASQRLRTELQQHYEAFSRLATPWQSLTH